MKPSERIFQLFNINRQKKGGNKNEDRIMAIIQYLDEQYEQNLTPEQLQGREKFKVFKERNNI